MYLRLFDKKDRQHTFTNNLSMYHQPYILGRYLVTLIVYCDQGNIILIIVFVVLKCFFFTVRNTKYLTFIGDNMQARVEDKGTVCVIWSNSKEKRNGVQWLS
jgi:hypothetical protein